MGKTNHPASGRLPWPTILAYVTPSLPLSALTLPIVVYLPGFYANQVGLPLAIVGLAFMLVRIGDIFLDPLIGTIVDQTRTGFGRFRLWMIIGAPFVVGGSMMLYFPPVGATAVWLFSGLGIVYLGYSACSLSHTAWGATLSTSYHERARIYGVWQSANITGLILVLTSPLIAAALGHRQPGDGVRAMGIFVIVLMPIAVALMTSLTPEHPPVDIERRRPWGATVSALAGLLRNGVVVRVLAADLILNLAPAIAGALFMFFFVKVKGYAASETSLLLLVYFIGGICGAPLWMRLSRWIGKHRALMCASGYYVVAQTSVVIFPHMALLPSAGWLFVAGLSYAANIFLLRALMADVVDAVRLSTGRDETPLLFAMIGGTSKLASAIAVGVTFNVLAAIGFHAGEGAVNTPAALSGLTNLFGFLPPVMAVLGASCFLGYSLTEARHVEIRAALDDQPAAPH